MIHRHKDHLFKGSKGKRKVKALWENEILMQKR